MINNPEGRPPKGPAAIVGLPHPLPGVTRITPGVGDRRRRPVDPLTVGEIIGGCYQPSLFADDDNDEWYGLLADVVRMACARGTRFVVVVGDQTA
jgi:hypothetical protein